MKICSRLGIEPLKKGHKMFLPSLCPVSDSTLIIALRRCLACNGKEQTPNDPLVKSLDDLKCNLKSGVNSCWSKWTR